MLAHTLRLQGGPAEVVQGDGSTYTRSQPAGYTLFKGFADLGGGLACGLAGLGAGMCIGIVGDAGVRASAQQPRLYVGMVLILIFSEALGLYGATQECLFVFLARSRSHSFSPGLIVGIIMSQKKDDDNCGARTTKTGTR